MLITRPEIFFPTAPAEYFEDSLTATGELAVGVGGLLVQTPDDTILIDAGVGVMRGDFVFGHADCGTLLDVLDALDVGVGDIDVVAFTHLHFDHAGWAYINGLKTFPIARYVLSAQEWAPHSHQESGDDGAVAGQIVEQLAAHGDAEFIADGAAVAYGVRAVVTGGHTPGHTAYVVTSPAGNRLVAFGDAFHNPVQITHPELLSAADSDAAGVFSARQRLLAELSVPHTIGFGIHFGDRSFGRVVTTADGRAEWDPVPTSVPTTSGG
ncbi:MBL fold metallo-hydrolase [Mycolicibacterium flavescens]|uniref:MBL fold metallo-hydrolase n=1 Tax=Mycolicibacterium flavescens TaxID=1776 RepID=UPI001F4577B6|nr:MBL fold metallo-hydrolase [Mycolicibacterium flavescens]